MTSDYRNKGTSAENFLGDKPNQLGSQGFASYFTDGAIAQDFYYLYQQALTQWERVPQTEFIRTRFGDTHILQLSASVRSDPAELCGKENSVLTDGPLVILLHGYGASSLMWQSIMPALSMRWDCIACDIPGQLGLSDNQGDRIRICWQFVSWLHEVVQNLGYGSRELIIIGYSYGGNLAARFAARYKSQVKYLMLIEPAVVFNTIRWNFFRNFMNFQRGKITPAQIEEFLEGKPQLDYYNPFTDAAIGLGFSYHARNKFITPLPVLSWKLASLSSRVSIFLAGKSEILHAKRARWIARFLIPGSHVQILPEATHSLPGEYSSEIIDELFRSAAG